MRASPNKTDLNSKLGMYNDTKICMGDSTNFECKRTHKIISTAKGKPFIILGDKSHTSAWVQYYETGISLC